MLTEWKKVVRNVAVLGTVLALTVSCAPDTLNTVPRSAVPDAAQMPSVPSVTALPEMYVRVLNNKDMRYSDKIVKHNLTAKEFKEQVVSEVQLGEMRNLCESFLLAAQESNLENSRLKNFNNKIFADLTLQDIIRGLADGLKKAHMEPIKKESTNFYLSFESLQNPKLYIELGKMRGSSDCFENGQSYKTFSNVELAIVLIRDYCRNVLGPQLGYLPEDPQLIADSNWISMYFLSQLNELNNSVHFPGTCYFDNTTSSERYTGNYYKYFSDYARNNAQDETWIRKVGYYDIPTATPTRVPTRKPTESPSPTITRTPLPTRPLATPVPLLPTKTPEPPKPVPGANACAALVCYPKDSNQAESLNSGKCEVGGKVGIRNSTGNHKYLLKHRDIENMWIHVRPGELSNFSVPGTYDLFEDVEIVKCNEIKSVCFVGSRSDPLNCNFFVK